MTKDEAIKKLIQYVEISIEIYKIVELKNNHVKNNNFEDAAEKRDKEINLKSTLPNLEELQEIIKIAKS